MVVECDALAAEAYHQDVQGTPYLELPADDWPEGHPRVTWARSSVHTIGYDQFPAGSLVRALYESDELLVFLGRILGREPLYRYADPIGALNLAVMIEGDVLDWHFDQTDFVVSLAIQSSERGGDFENAAMLRSPDDENYDSGHGAERRRQCTRRRGRRADDTRHAHAFEGRQSLQPPRRWRERDRATSGCSATTPSPTRCRPSC